MTDQEVDISLSCKCGGYFVINGHTSLEIEGNFLVRKGDCYCDSCGEHKKYRTLNEIDLKRPFDITLEEV